MWRVVAGLTRVGGGGGGGGGVSVAEEPSKPQEVNGKREPKPRRCRRRQSNPFQSWPVQVQYERLNRLYV